mmetsp:Transcript_2532/g.11145  ORF Transcript_2532/g.11145 Transcript_2532/m.11145 type:complete len:254 (+) Transcript_2532:223-984(+)
MSRCEYQDESCPAALIGNRESLVAEQNLVAAPGSADLHSEMQLRYGVAYKKTSLDRIQGFPTLKNLRPYQALSWPRITDSVGHLERLIKHTILFILRKSSSYYTIVNRVLVFREEHAFAALPSAFLEAAFGVRQLAVGSVGAAGALAHFSNRDDLIHGQANFPYEPDTSHVVHDDRFDLILPPKAKVQDIHERLRMGTTWRGHSPHELLVLGDNCNDSTHRASIEFRVEVESCWTSHSDDDVVTITGRSLISV